MKIKNFNTPIFEGNKKGVKVGNTVYYILRTAYFLFLKTTTIVWLTWFYPHSVLDVHLNMTVMEVQDNLKEELWKVIEKPPNTEIPKKQAKISRKWSAKLMPIEGSWRLIANENFEEVLYAIGATPLIATMVLR